MGLFVMNNLRHYTVQWPLLQIIQAYTHQCKIKKMPQTSSFNYILYFNRKQEVHSFFCSQKLDARFAGKAAIKADLLKTLQMVLGEYILRSCRQQQKNKQNRIFQYCTYCKLFKGSTSTFRRSLCHIFSILSPSHQIGGLGKTGIYFFVFRWTGLKLTGTRAAAEFL